MKSMVTTAIQNLCIEVFFIPLGCTGLVQPMDVGFNKSFKAKMHSVYQEWLLAQDADKLIPNAKRSEVAAWIVAANLAVSPNVIMNVWRKMGYSYFPDEDGGINVTSELTDNDDMTDDGEYDWGGDRLNGYDGNAMMHVADIGEYAKEGGV